MKRAVIACAGLVVAGVLTPGAWAQFSVPSVPSVPGIGSALPSAGSALSGAGGLSGLGSLSGASAVPGVASAVPGVASAAQPTTLWSFLGLSKANLAGCKASFCQSQLGSLVNNGMLPFSALTGGIIGGCCPTTPNASQLAAAAAAGGAEGVAAQIKAEEAQAKARIAALEYLATVDCRYWPDAEKVIIERLRADRNECVRYAAARALGTGCCCTKKTIAALKLVVECTDSDGNVPERSERVKAAAWYALSHCASRYIPSRPEPKERPSEPSRREYPAAYQPGLAVNNPRAAAFEEMLDNTPDEVFMEDVRRVLVETRGAPLGERTLPTGSRSVFHAVLKAAGPTVAMASTSAPVPAPATAGSAVVIRSTAPPVPNVPATPPPPIHLETDPALRKTSAEVASPAARKPPRSLLELITASRRTHAGA